MPQNNFSQPRTVTASERGGLDIRNLVLLAILLAAGFILNMTVGKALSALTMGTLSPEFIIAAFCLEILIVRPKPAQALVIGLIAGAVIQITASVKGPDLIAEPIAALVMALIVAAGMKGKAKAIVPVLGQPPLPRSVNIETVGWGSEGTLVLKEIGSFLGQCGITVHCWIPSAPLELLITAPAARLNLVKRVRWARRMKERFGTDYLHLGGAGRYTGLEGIALFYRDIGEKLGLLDEMEPLIAAETEKALAQTETARRTLADYRCALVCRGRRASS